MYLAEEMYKWLWNVVYFKVKPSTFDRNYRVFNNYLKESSLSYLEIQKITKNDVQILYNIAFHVVSD